MGWPKRVCKCGESHECWALDPVECGRRRQSGVQGGAPKNSGRVAGARSGAIDPEVTAANPVMSKSVVRRLEAQGAIEPQGDLSPAAPPTAPKPRPAAERPSPGAPAQARGIAKGLCEHDADPKFCRMLPCKERRGEL